MKIDLFVSTYNNEDTIDDLINWYQGANITVLDNYSSDDTTKIATENGCQVVLYGDQYRNPEVTKSIKESFWRNSKADWVIVINSNEYLFHPRLFQVLSGTQTSVIKCVGYDLKGKISLDTIKTEEAIRNKANDKSVCFRPNKIKELNWNWIEMDKHPVAGISYLVNTVKLFCN